MTTTDRTALLIEQAIVEAELMLAHHASERMVTYGDDDTAEYRRLVLEIAVLEGMCTRIGSLLKMQERRRQRARDVAPARWEIDGGDAR